MKIRNKKLTRGLGAMVGAAAIRLIGLTVRVRFEDPHGLVVNQSNRGNLIFAFWHNRLFLMPYLYRKHRPGYRMIALISPSGDGQMIAEIAAKFGVGSARGSSSRDGGAALRAMVREVDAGLDAGVTPDGPRGPKGVVQQGVLRLAQRTNRPVVPLNLQYSAKWELRSWDRFQIPKPFARCTIVLGEPLPVPPGADDAEIKRLAGELAERIGV